MLHPHFLWFYTFSTLCSSFFLIMFSGGAGSMCCPLNWSSLHHVSRSLLNMLYITHPSGNFSWNTSCPMSFVISNDLYLFWFSFFEGYFNWMFFAFNHILSSCFYPCVTIQNSESSQKEPCIRVITRELNRDSSTMYLSYIYWTNSLLLCYKLLFHKNKQSPKVFKYIILLWKH